MRLATTLLFSLFLFAFYPNEKAQPEKSVATCYGYTPCNACSNCSRCRWCNAGGTCGKCARVKPVMKVKSPVVSTQCKAITKAGTRCKRRATMGGYCWQHG